MQYCSITSFSAEDIKWHIRIGFFRTSKSSGGEGGGEGEGLLGLESHVTIRKVALEPTIEGTFSGADPWPPCREPQTPLTCLIFFNLDCTVQGPPKIC